MGGGRNEYDIPVAFPPVLMVGPDDHQSRIFPGSSRVGLEGDGGKAGYFPQGPFQFIDHLVGPLHLVDGNKGMDP